MPTDKKGACRLVFADHCINLNTADMRFQEKICVWVRDPKVQKDEWPSYLDYEVCMYTDSMCFTLKTSCVRRRFREFVWLRQRLQSNAVLTSLPDLPPKYPFFNLINSQNVEQRVRGLQAFLEKVMQCSVLLSDSRLHLFLQTQLSPVEIEACASGQTRYTVADAIHNFAASKRRFPAEVEDDESLFHHQSVEEKEEMASCVSEKESEKTDSLTDTVEAAPQE